MPLAAQPGSDTYARLYSGFQSRAQPANLAPYWFWNGRITADETRRQLRAMAAQHVRAATVMNWAGLEPAYLSEAWWKEVGTALDEAKALGITLNFSDEHLWPSAQVWDYASMKREPSRVLQLHPEYRMKRLTARQWKPEENWRGQPAEVVVAARLLPGGGIDEASLALAGREWKPAEGQWSVFTYTAVEAMDRGVRTDLLNPAAVRTFLDLVYEEYARRFPQHLGTTIKTFVSDHEGSYGAATAFTPKLWETFEQRHHYDLRPLLPLLGGNSPRATQVRQDYLETISHLYTTNYVQQITDWCTRHRVEHGHSDIEENMLFQVRWTGNMFDLWRASSAIFIDALIERARMPVDFQEAVSVAHFEGRPLLVELGGLLGHDSYFSLERLKLVSNMAIVWGANRLMSHYFEYDPTHLQYPPSVFLTQPQFREYEHAASLTQRGLYLNSQGRHDAQVAIYHPLESAYAGAGELIKEGSRLPPRWNNLMDETQEYYTGLQLDLSRLGWSYHMMDQRYLERATLKGAALSLAGEEFRVMILPPMTHIAQSSARKLRAFAQAGGTLLALGPQPAEVESIPGLRRFPLAPHDPVLRNDYVSRFVTPEPMRQSLAPLFEALVQVVPPMVQMAEGSRENLYFSHRADGGTEWYWAANDSAEVRTVKLRLPRSGAYEKWDAETGQRYQLGAGPELTLRFGPYEAFAIVRNPSASTAPPLPGSDRRLLHDLSGQQWSFTPESPVRVPYAEVNGAPVWLSPERLAQRAWWLSGPYPYNGHSGFFDQFAPERGYLPGSPAAPQSQPWEFLESETNAVRPKDRNGVYYAFLNVWSPQARAARAALAANDGVKLWINGALAFEEHSHPPFVNLRDGWSHRPPVQLKQGWNTVLIKICPASAGATGFLFRITDEQGATLRDVEYSRDQTRAAAAESRPVRVQVQAPPGTAGPSIDQSMDARTIPERPYVFTPQAVKTPLFCWTDTTLANYSGTALYETEFTLPALPRGKRIYLDLGKVGLTAELSVNGRPAGSRAWTPYEFEVTALVQPGPNRLRIRVANSDAGWMAQGDPIYERGAWGVRFATERERLKTLHPNGLEGPVRLLID
ncbi:MAG: hypothetical protein HY821_04145 [Acidobacteria bacterium]|nr:hypothetical protein [Acidobacteriota bacterium]